MSTKKLNHLFYCVDFDNINFMSKESELYQKLGSVHKVGFKLGITGETVRKRLIKEGFRLNNPHWSNDEIQILKKEYSNTNGVDVLQIAKKLKRTHAGITCKAEELGLTSRRGCNILTPEQKHNMLFAHSVMCSNTTNIQYLKDNYTKESCPMLAKRFGVTSATINNWAKRLKLKRDPKQIREHLQNVDPATVWKRHPHPRGNLGKHHSEQTKCGMSIRVTKFWSSMNKREREIQSMKMLKARFLNNGTLITSNRVKASWKAAWREVGGRRIFFRSRWEANYARYLQLLKEQNQIKEWEHEPETFWFEGVRRGCVSYLPDFKVTNRDDTFEFHEVKGWMDDRSKTKLKRMAKYHPSIKLILIQAEWFKKNGNKLTWLPGWEDQRS
jgi:hypothetical protein